MQLVPSKQGPSPLPRLAFTCSKSLRCPFCKVRKSGLTPGDGIKPAFEVICPSHVAYSLWGGLNNSSGEGWGLALLPMQCLQTPMRIDRSLRFGTMRELAGYLCMVGFWTKKMNRPNFSTNIPNIGGL